MNKVGPAPPSGQPSSLVPVKNSRAPGEVRADTLGSWSGQSPVGRAGSLQLHCREQGYDGRAAAVRQPVGTGQMAQRLCLRGSSKSTLGGELSKTNPPPAKPSVRPRGREKKRQKRDTPHIHTHTHTHTHTHSLARTPGTSIHVHTHVHGRRGTEEAMYSAAQQGPWLVQSQRKGWAGNTTSPWRAGPSQPQGPGTQHRGVQRPQSPQESESGPRHLGILAHTPHTHTSACLRVHSGHRCPTSWTAHHGNRVATSQLQSPPEGLRGLLSWGKQR